MANVAGLLAIHRVAYWTRIIKHYHTDLLIDTEVMIGRFSNMTGPKFGWAIDPFGTHFLNPVFFSHTEMPEYLERTREGIMLFWFDGEQLHEVTGEQLKDLMQEEYLTYDLFHTDFDHFHLNDHAQFLMRVA